MGCRFVDVVFEDVPAGEDDVVKIGERNEVLDEGELLSVRLPRRMVPICVREPMGLARPRRTASTPAMNVVATAPRPTTMTPSFPLAGATFDASADFLPSDEDMSAGPADLLPLCSSVGILLLPFPLIAESTQNCIF